MSRIEEVELTNMCMICDGKGNVLVQNKTNHPFWHGWNFPGGHVEEGESFTDAVIREVQEETGLTIQSPQLCGIKEWSENDCRHVVLLYKTNQFTGTLHASEEGDVFWQHVDELKNADLAEGMEQLLQVFLDFAKANKLAFLTLEVRASNYDAIALYGSRGFRSVGRRKNYYEHPKEDAIIMTLEFDHGTENPDA